ncbi:glycoside hydrolase family 104 protein [Ralstonia pseudosolanacearum]|uniref:glycoside hydrolase family 24 protein n=1 Tax=Ralstonia solanacearum species complex TaxID=3116862 RepID=UPI002006708A|nr:glycoside hydrolase family 104 protein [Ralstonia pseudosolanacearum]MCK4121419.1 glycoside hydrolase family 104 protein [Ralstonia pseudosolanacearum]
MQPKTDKNLAAFLDMIAVSELGRPLLAKSDNGYNVIVGSTAGAPKLFHSYADHPRQIIEIRPGLKSTAAGRYQLLARYFDVYKRQLGLQDFSPASQDAIAVQQIRERSALADIQGGRLAAAIAKCKNIWASLPGAGYGQNEHSLAYLQAAYVSAGGFVAA